MRLGDFTLAYLYPQLYERCYEQCISVQQVLVGEITYTDSKE